MHLILSSRLLKKEILGLVAMLLRFSHLDNEVIERGSKRHCSRIYQKGKIGKVAQAVVSLDHSPPMEVPSE